MEQNMETYIGTAGWCIPKGLRDYFPEGDNLLWRYSRVFNAVEINSSFYKHHKSSTYERWRDEVPENFRFSVKLSRHLTHELKLQVSEHDFDLALQPLFELKEKLGCLLVQLPPSLMFDLKTAPTFFAGLREKYSGLLVLEPRHPSWISQAALNMLKINQVSLVHADPTPFTAVTKLREELPTYLRLHGSPVMYESSYSEMKLARYMVEMDRIRSTGVSPWCIFDNTKFGHATTDALKLMNQRNIFGKELLRPVTNI
jgi:uncharacterized protein YecE (DUF72 family)